MAEMEIPQPAHEHKQDIDIALIGERLTAIAEDVKSIKVSIKGNGKPGLETEIALNKQSIKRAWWWLGAISVGGVGLALRMVLK